MALNINPGLLFILAIGSVYGTVKTDYETEWELKSLCYATLVGTMSVCLVPLIHMYSIPIIYDAAIASSFTMGSLAVVAYNSPSEQFLNWGGPLAIGMGVILGVSLL